MAGVINKQLNEDAFLAVIERYLSGLKADPYHRYKSWDHCFEAFKSELDTNQLALHLGFYLASWGMYRGSSGLLQKSYVIHEGAVRILLQDEYKQLYCNEKNEIGHDLVDSIFGLHRELSVYYSALGSVGKPISPTDTLISKILLGTTACVPAYDRYFIMGLSAAGMVHRRFSVDSLHELLILIEHNKPLIFESQRRIKTTIGSYYPFMKIMDMFFWQTGFEKNNSNSGTKDGNTTV